MAWFVGTPEYARVGEGATAGLASTWIARGVSRGWVPWPPRPARRSTDIHRTRPLRGGGGRGAPCVVG